MLIKLIYFPFQTCFPRLLYQLLLLKPSDGPGGWNVQIQGILLCLSNSLKHGPCCVLSIVTPTCCCFILANSFGRTLSKENNATVSCTLSKLMDLKEISMW